MSPSLSPRRAAFRPGLVAFRTATGVTVLGLVLWVSNCRLDRLLKGASADGPLLVSPAVVRDSAIAGSGERPRITVQIAGGGSRGWRASEDVSWISLDPTSGGARSLLTITLHPERLDPGSHDAVVLVTSEEAPDPAEIAITFVIHQPILKVTPREFSYSTRSDRVFVDTIRIDNDGTGPLVWTAAIVSDDEDEDDDDDDDHQNPDWLTIERAEGTGNGAIPIRVDSDDVRVGTHEKFVVIRADGAKGSPTQVKVKLRRRRW